MGILIDSQIETSQGPTSNLYFRIDSWKINRSVGDITFTTTSWVSKKFADNFLRSYYDEPLRNAIGLVSSRVIFYEENDTIGTEMIIDNLYKVPMYEEVEVDEPIYGVKETSKEVPYVSFDENGEEITLYKTVTQKEKVQTGTEKVLKKVMDYSIVNRLEEFCYDHLAEKLEHFFPKEIIKRV